MQTRNLTLNDRFVFPTQEFRVFHWECDESISNSSTIKRFVDNMFIKRELVEIHSPVAKFEISHFNEITIAKIVAIVPVD